MSTKKTVRKPAKVWMQGDVVPADTTVYKVVNGGKNGKFILKCKTVGDGIAINHASSGPCKVKFKVPGLDVKEVYVIEGGYCDKCGHTEPKRAFRDFSRTKFTSEYEPTFKYTLGKTAVQIPFDKDTLCGNGLHCWSTKAAALSYATV